MVPHALSTALGSHMEAGTLAGRPLLRSVAVAGRRPRVAAAAPAGSGRGRRSAQPPFPQGAAAGAAGGAAPLGLLNCWSVMPLHDPCWALTHSTVFELILPTSLGSVKPLFLQFPSPVMPRAPSCPMISLPSHSPSGTQKTWHTLGKSLLMASKGFCSLPHIPCSGALFCSMRPGLWKCVTSIPLHGPWAYLAQVVAYCMRSVKPLPWQFPCPTMPRWFMLPDCTWPTQSPSGMQ
mmetsp:Transcript_45064/g.127460  ORF Transcript_45064/g.127460 Transcript_45064/m.127460 type:complete len:235 (-) Transcript_45064:611-1315(-)